MEAIGWLTEHILKGEELECAWNSLSVGTDTSEEFHNTSQEQLILLYAVESVVRHQEGHVLEFDHEQMMLLTEHLASVKSLRNGNLSESQRVWCHLNVKKTQLILRVIARVCEILEGINEQNGKRYSFQEKLFKNTALFDFCVEELRTVHYHSVDIGKRDERCTIDLPSGYRSDLMRTIGCLVYGNEDAQKHLLNTDGIPVVLNHCRILQSEPLLREWAVLTIRNLCESNEEIRNIISKYRAQDVANPEEASRMGFEANVDEGKLNVRPKKP